jgi:hypothetical protein
MNDFNGERFNHELKSQFFSKLPDAVRELCPDADIDGGRCFGIGGDSYVGVKDGNGHWRVFSADNPKTATPTCHALTEPELRRLVMKLATRI